MEKLNFKIQNINEISENENYDILVDKWLKNERYSNTNLYIKRLCIVNEHYLSCLMKKNGEIKHIKDIFNELTRKSFLDRGFNERYIPIERNKWERII